MPEAEKEQEAATPKLSKPWTIAIAAGASVTSSWALSFLGIPGTMAGVAAGSAVSGVAAALYERWMLVVHSAAKGRLARRKAHAAGAGGQDPCEQLYRPREAARRGDIPWKRAAAIAGVCAAISLGSVLAAEAAVGKPAAAIVTGHPGAGCTICGGVVRPDPTSSPTDTPVPVLSPTTSSSPSPSPSPAMLAPAPPSSSPSPSPSPSPVTTVSPSPSPTITTP